MKHFDIVKEEDMPLDVLPAPAIWVPLEPTHAVRTLFEGVKRTICCDVNRPIILQVRRGDRYEIRERFTRIVKEKPRIGRFRFIAAREFERVLFDTQPDPTVVIDGENFPYYEQQGFVRMMRQRPAFAPRLVVLTEQDPGELAAGKRWSSEFRSTFHRTYAFPRVTERAPKETELIIGEFLRHLQQDLWKSDQFDLKIHAGGLELFSRMLIAAGPKSVHRLFNGSKKLVRDLLADGKDTVSGNTVSEIVLKSDGWKEATANVRRAAAGA